MKVKCPTCGAVGTDVEPIPEDMRGPSWKPLKGEDQYAFAVHGRHGGRAVRKCLNCGAGVYVKLLPPRYQAIPPERWEHMQVYFEEQMAESRARTRAALAELADEQESPEPRAAVENDPAFQAYVERLVGRVNELWESEKNPMMRESGGGPPGDLERAIIEHVTRSTAPAFGIELAERGAQPDQVQISWETKALMYLMARGYLWREAERERASDDAPLKSVEVVVQWTKEHPGPDETQRFKKLARAVYWTLQGFFTLALPSDGETVSGEASLDLGFESQSAEIQPSDMILGKQGMRAAFQAGVALREVEPFF
jgi:hypothetical protein